MPKYLINLSTGRLTDYTPAKAKFNHLSPISDTEAEQVKLTRKAQEEAKKQAKRGVRTPLVIEGEIDNDDLNLEGLEDLDGSDDS